MRKCNEKAQELRETGNDLHRSEQYFQAILAYNHGLLYAETGSTEVALLYGNRSASYFSLGEYQLCLDNIELARAHGFPGAKLHRLAARENSCRRLLREAGEPQEDERLKLFRMSYPTNPRLPSLAECVELGNDGNEPCLTTNRDLYTGDVIAKIEPLMLLFNQRARLHHCTYCGKNSMLLSLIPCPNCTKGKKVNSCLSEF